MERIDKLLRDFLRRRYDLSIGRVYAKLRTVLLEDMEHVPCNLCGSNDSVEIAHRDKYDLPITSAICRNCGLMYLNPRPTTASYGRFYTEGGSTSGFITCHSISTIWTGFLSATLGRSSG